MQFTDCQSGTMTLGCLATIVPGYREDGAGLDLHNIYILYIYILLIRYRYDYRWCLTAQGLGKDLLVGCFADCSTYS